MVERRKLTYEPKVRLTILEPDGTEIVRFLRGNMSVHEALSGYKRVRHKGELLSGNEMLKELMEEDGSLVLQVR